MTAFNFCKKFHLWCLTGFNHSSDPPPPPPLFLKEGSKFWLPPPEGGKSKKLKKGASSMVQGKVFLKREGGGGGWLTLFLFSKFIIFTFRNYFTLCKIVFCICRKIIFCCHHNLGKKVIPFDNHFSKYLVFKRIFYMQGLFWVTYQN